MLEFLQAAVLLRESTHALTKHVFGFPWNTPAEIGPTRNGHGNAGREVEARLMGGRIEAMWRSQSQA